MANIVLISPYYNVFAIGLRVLSSCLKRAGHDVKIFFLAENRGEKYEEGVLNEIIGLSKDADLIGISVMTNFFAKAAQLTRAIKAKMSTPVIWGGIHSTILPMEALEYADMVCVGEGEESMVELAEKIKLKEEFLNIRGIWYKRGVEIIKSEIRPFVKDLNSIPAQDFDYSTHYLLANGRLLKVDEPLLNKSMGGFYTTVASRGCFFECSYCVNSALKKMFPSEKGVRKRSIESIMEELRMVKNRLPFTKFIQFDDDAFLAYTKEEIEDFSKQYKKDIGLRLGITGISPTTANYEKIKLLIDAGLVYVRMGIQTASERTKKMYKRCYSNKQVEEAAILVSQFKNKLRIIEFDIILDNPWETDDDLISTLMFLIRLPRPYSLAMYSLTFYPGTMLYEKAKNERIIKEVGEEVYNKLYGVCKKTYMNRLFFLLSDYARHGMGISPIMMALLTDRKIRSLRINWLLYYMLRTCALSFGPINLMKKGFGELRSGKFSKILVYLKEKIKR